jgi:hypothetical protein
VVPLAGGNERVRCTLKDEMYVSTVLLFRYASSRASMFGVTARWRKTALKVVRDSLNMR